MFLGKVDQAGVEVAKERKESITRRVVELEHFDSRALEAEVVDGRLVSWIIRRSFREDLQNRHGTWSTKLSLLPNNNFSQTHTAAAVHKTPPRFDTKAFKLCSRLCIPHKLNTKIGLGALVGQPQHVSDKPQFFLLSLKCWLYPQQTHNWTWIVNGICIMISPKKATMAEKVESKCSCKNIMIIHDHLGHENDML